MRRWLECRVADAADAVSEVGGQWLDVADGFLAAFTNRVVLLWAIWIFVFCLVVSI